MDSATVLLSSGMDSVITFFIARQEKQLVNAICIDYGQRGATNEVLRAHRIHSKYAPHGSEFKVMKIDPSNLAGGSSLIRRDIPVDKYKDVRHIKTSPRDKSFLYARNSIFLALAANWAVGEWDDKEIYTGLREGAFPDDKIIFTEATAHALSLGLFGDVIEELKIISPLIFKSRGESIRIAQAIPGCMEALAYSWSCYEAGDQPCGSCSHCIDRAAAFSKLGIKDPAQDVIFLD